MISRASICTNDFHPILIKPLSTKITFNPILIKNIYIFLNLDNFIKKKKPLSNFI